MKDDIGLKYAKKISNSFQAWAKDERNSRGTKISKFNPTNLITEAFQKGGEYRFEDINHLAGVAESFNIRSPTAIEWCAKYAADQIKYIDSGTRDAIKQVTLKGLEEGLNPREQSAAIKEIVGLLPQHIQAVENYKESLIDLAPGTVDNMVSEYADKLLKWRADTIGLTESLTAANNGSRIAVEDASDRGILPKDEYELEWQYTPDDRVCDDCEEMNGQRTEIGGAFDNGLDCPPLHPRCRCDTIIVRKEE